MAGPVAFPAPGMELTHILVVRDLARSRDWYRDVLGATLTGEYGGSSAIFNFQGAWLLVVTPGGETPDKPGRFCPTGGSCANQPQHHDPRAGLPGRVRDVARPRRRVPDGAPRIGVGSPLFLWRPGRSPLRDQ